MAIVSRFVGNTKRIYKIVSRSNFIERFDS